VLECHASQTVINLQNIVGQGAQHFSPRIQLSGKFCVILDNAVWKRAAANWNSRVSWMKIFNGLRWDMLVLTRRVDESIRIGDDIRITVVKIKGTQQICVGVDAPRDVPVLREELLIDRSELVDESESSNS